MQCGRVAATFQFSRRRKNWSFTHHAKLCTVEDPAVQDRFLDWYEEPLAETGKPPGGGRA
jgi:hypothetical protein